MFTTFVGRNAQRSPRIEDTARPSAQNGAKVYPLGRAFGTSPRFQVFVESVHHDEKHDAADCLILAAVLL
jgi:hypothetical protein